MYRLMISFKKSEVLDSVWNGPKEYLLPNAEEVCKVLTSLSHLDPIITCCQIPVLSAEDVLKDFELKEV